MPGILKHHLLNLNDKRKVEEILTILKRLISDNKIYTLEVSKRYYFKLSKEISNGPGWYVILDEKKQPLYVGKSDNLNVRLNTQDGSRDNFANPTRKSDPERNFIKKLRDLNIFKKLHVVIIDEQDLCSQLGIEFPLQKIDRENIEKLINIFRNLLIK